jgi:hypothetical protein
MSEWMDQIIPTVVGAVAGWLANSVRKANKSDLDPIYDRLSEIEAEQKEFITRTEFRDGMRELKTELAKQHEILGAQIQQLNHTLLTRRGTTQS